MDSSSKPKPDTLIALQERSTNEGETSRCMLDTMDQEVAAQPSRTCCKCQVKNHTKKLIAGVCLMMVGAVCWVGVTQTADLTHDDPHFDCPLFLVYFATSWLIIVFPLYIVVQLISTRGSFNVAETLRDGLRTYGDDGFAACPYKIFVKCAGFTFLWDLAGYLYMRALDFRSAQDAVTLFATNANFVYLLSWIVLQKKFISIRIVAFILGMTGTIFLIYMQSGFESKNMWGAILVIISTAAAALYKVLFRKVVGDIPVSQVTFCISFLGLFNLITLWPMVLLLHFTEAEKIQPTLMPWQLMSITAAFMIGCKFVLTFGVALTYSLLLNSMFILAIPLAIGTNTLLDENHTLHLNGVQIGSYLLIITSFCINILPDNWHEKVLKKLKIKQRIESPDESHLSPRQRINQHHQT